MRATDFDHELGIASDGVTVYPSIESLKKHQGCVSECGIAEVFVTLARKTLPVTALSAEDIERIVNSRVPE